MKAAEIIKVEVQQEEDNAQPNEPGESEEEDDPPLNEPGELEEALKFYVRFNDVMKIKV